MNIWDYMPTLIYVKFLWMVLFIGESRRVVFETEKLWFWASQITLEDSIRDWLKMHWLNYSEPHMWRWWWWWYVKKGATSLPDNAWQNIKGAASRWKTPPSLGTTLSLLRVTGKNCQSEAAVMSIDIMKYWNIHLYKKMIDTENIQ